MSIPNGRPQSPMWFSRTTSWPTALNMRTERVADHRRAQVPDVHLLGHVGSRVVDDDPFRRRRLGDAEALVGGDLGDQRADEPGVAASG